MAVVYRDAKLFVNGANLSGSLKELGIEYSAEMLDETCFGDDTRITKGGLFTAKIAGSGFFDTVTGIETVVFEAVGVDDAVLSVFPDGITEGSLTTGSGFSMKGVLSTMNVGADVGQLLAVDFGIESRGA